MARDKARLGRTGFWDAAEEASSEVRQWPKWKTESFNIETAKLGDKAQEVREANKNQTRPINS